MALPTIQPVIQQSGTPGSVGPSGIQGGGFTQITQVRKPDTSDPTFDLLMKLGGQVMGQAIAKREQQLFLQGAQRVAQGEALTSIVEDQPWITKIFGESASVQGARTLAQITQVDKFHSDLIGNMDELAKISPNEIGGIVNEKMAEHLTGDATADAVIMQKMAEVSGAFYNQHAKANYKYVQQNMQNKVTDMMVGAAGALQGIAAGRLEGTISDDDWNLAQARVAGNLMPLAGQSQESYWAAVEQATTDALAQENHHFVNLVFNSGLINEAPSETRVKLIDERRKYEAITREKAGYLEYGARIGQLKGMAASGVISGNQIMAEVDRMNKEFSLKYGIEDTLFSRDEFTAMISGNYKKIYSRQEERAKESMKHQQELESQRQVMMAVQAGMGNTAMFAGAKKEVFDTTFYAGVETARANGGDWTSIVVENFNSGAGYVNPFVQNEMQAGMRASKMEGYGGESFERSYSQFKQIATKPGGKAAALKYLGEDDGVRMLKYDDLVNTGVNAAAAYQVAFGEPIAKGRIRKDDEVASILDKTVEKLEPGFWASLGGAEKLSPSAQKIITSSAGKYMDLFTSNLGVGDEAAARLALDVAKNEIDIVGAYAYPKKIGQAPVSALIGSDNETAGKVFNEYIAEQARKSGVKLDLAGKKDDGGASFAVDLVRGGLLGAVSGSWSRAFQEDGDVHIMRQVDKIDETTNLPYTTFVIYVTSPDGDTATIPVDSREVRKYYESHKNFK